MTHALRASHEAALTPQRVRELFSYSPKDGRLHWRKSRHGVRAGSIAGRIHRAGYRHVLVDKKSYSAHRLAWCHFHGSWPELYIDHVNGDRADNRIENLREASHSQNLWNSRRFTSKGAKPKGVTRLRNGCWQAQIGRFGKNHYLGKFDSAEEAHAAYLTAAKAMFGEFARAA